MRCLCGRLLPYRRLVLETLRVTGVLAVLLAAVRERPSCAGLRVEVLKRPDGGLIVQYQGHTVATQEPPPRMGALWAAVNSMVARP